MGGHRKHHFQLVLDPDLSPKHIEGLDPKRGVRDIRPLAHVRALQLVYFELRRAFDPFQTLCASPTSGTLFPRHGLREVLGEGDEEHNPQVPHQQPHQPAVIVTLAPHAP